MKSALWGPNQLPKGSLWSAISSSLLCMIVSMSLWKQGSGPIGSEEHFLGGGLKGWISLCPYIPPPTLLNSQNPMK